MNTNADPRKSSSLTELPSDEASVAAFPHAASIAHLPLSRSVPHQREFSQFDTLNESPLAVSLRSSDAHYRVLCDALDELGRDPRHFTLFMKRLRMLVIEGRSFQDIATSQDPPVKATTLWAQISKTARALLCDAGMKGSVEDFKRVTAHLKRASFEVRFQPWLEWFSQWRGDPLGVEPPPPVFGLVAQELFDRLGLGRSQQGKGVSGIARPGRAPEPVRREFSVHPFERDGFFGVEVRAMPEAFADCPEVMPRPRALALGYHEKLGSDLDASGRMARRIPALDPEPVKPRVAAVMLRILEGCLADNRDRLIGPTGALECLRRGIGPFDVHALTSIREICRSERAAYLDLLPFARGERHIANSLRFPERQLEQLGVTHARIHFEARDIAELRNLGRVTFSVLGYGSDAPDRSIVHDRGELGRVEILERDGKLRVKFSPVTSLINERSRWYRGEVLNPRLEEILEGGATVEVPSIGWRELNRDPVGRYPSFHMLDHDFFLPQPFNGSEVFVRGHVEGGGDRGVRAFTLIAYRDESLAEVAGAWTAEVGAPRSARQWRRVLDSEIPSVAP